VISLLSLPVLHYGEASYYQIILTELKHYMLHKLLIALFIIATVFFSCSDATRKRKEESFRLAHQSERLLKENSFDSAKILLDKSLELDSENYIAYNNRAYLKNKWKRPPEEVISDYKKALAYNPGYAIGIYSLTNYYFVIKDYENTVKMASKYLALQLSQELDSGMIEDIYAKMGESEKYLLQFDNAIIDLKKALEIKPKNEFAHKELGDCYYYGRNDIALALEEYSKAIELDSNYFQAYYARANCYRNSNPPRLKEAAIDDKKAKALDSSHDFYTLYDTLSKFRKSSGTKIKNADSFYQSISSELKKAKVPQQKVIDYVVFTLQNIQNNSNAKVNIKYLQQLTDGALISNRLALKAVENMDEIDSIINLKAKFVTYEGLFGGFLNNDISQWIFILKKNNKDRFTESISLLEPKVSLLKNEGILYEKAKEAFMSKYSLY